MKRFLELSIVALSLALLLSSAGRADERILGAYGSPGEHIVVVTQWGEDHYLLDMKDGQARRLDQVEDLRFVYGATRSSTDPVAGTIHFETDAAGRVVGLLDWSAAGRLPRIALTTRAVEFDNGESAHLAGTLISPPTAPRAWVLLLAGEGPNTRWDEWDVAAWLGAHGIGSLIFDQRGVGESTGEDVEGNYHVRSMAAASDASAAMRFLLAQPSTGDLPAGVFGHSQGGWIGAIVAREVAGVAFYVNFAGNGSPPWAQWRHAMTTWLHRKLVPLDQMGQASAYFDSFFGVYHQQTAWSDYVVALARSREEGWWPVMKQRYYAEWESETEAREYAAAEAINVPAEDFRQVTVPTLGLFFEHDHSTTLDTPHIFLEALTAGGNGDVTVRVFPGGDHGAWVVDGFRADRSQITRRLSAPYEQLRDWILGLALRSPE